MSPDGTIAAWEQVAVGQSFIVGSPFEQAMVKNGLDETMIEGAHELHYAIPNLQVDPCTARKSASPCSGGARSAIPIPPM